MSVLCFLGLVSLGISAVGVVDFLWCLAVVQSVGRLGGLNYWLVSRLDLDPFGEPTTARDISPLWMVEMIPGINLLFLVSVVVVGGLVIFGNLSSWMSEVINQHHHQPKEEAAAKIE